MVKLAVDKRKLLAVNADVKKKGIWLNLVIICALNRGIYLIPFLERSSIVCCCAFYNDKL